MTFPGLQGIKEGWYDGASIGFAVLLVVFVTGIASAITSVYGYFCEQLYKLVIHIDFIAATTDYKQSLQFQNLNEEKQNISLEVNLRHTAL
jgi:Ca2+-transporting ATPase